MIEKKALQIGLAAVEEVAEIERKGAGQGDEDDDEDVGQRSSEIGRQLALGDDGGVGCEFTKFRLLEVAYKAASGPAWTYRRDVGVSEALRPHGAVDGVALVAAEKN